ncbi:MULTISPECIES: exodeoxyribonuclease VII small subunit [Fusobacterium]|uniref:exodeoxyribonuclease VII small subunit n=1 Tax=Fusobacterium TaxID=848 RepID=UPI0015A5BBD9|nr:MULTISPECIES: exodeoxyribonuclease VII small subunit [Fusobacterium]MCF2612196.1 exodeoxyribonuclease VII small subunit [Fusobacterium perfoetens]MDY2980942.1 exodeoxyribonuclease VII small subunit [Fusobacterium sp.]
MGKSISFEKALENIDEIISKLENESLTLDESIKEYEKAMKYIKTAKDIIDSAEGKLLKVIKDSNDEIQIEEFEVKENA